MQFKDFFQKKYILFYLTTFSFIFLLVATLAIGFEFKQTNQILTLNDITRTINNLKRDGLPVPKLWSKTFGLLVSGLVFSGISLILLGLNLFEIQRIKGYHDSIWWLGLIFNLLAMILILAGEGYFGNETTKTLTPQKFEDIFNVGRLVGLIIAISAFPLTTFILGTIWYVVTPVEK